MIAYDVKWPILYLFSKLSQGYSNIELEDVPNITSFCMDTNTHLFWTPCNANVSQEQKYFLLFSFTTLTYVWQILSSLLHIFFHCWIGGIFKVIKIVSSCWILGAESSSGKIFILIFCFNEKYVQRNQ